MHSKRRHKIFVCSVILGELQSFRNYKNYERANFSDSPLHHIFESEHFSFPPLLDWRTIYSIPFECAIDTKSREFQYKILNIIYPSMISFLRLGIVSLLSLRSVTQQRKIYLICFFIGRLHKISGIQFNHLLEVHFQKLYNPWYN